MSKLDQMRRQREDQYARQQQQSSGTPSKVAPARVVAEEKAKAISDADEGKCSVCGKMKALSNGLVTNHQKGFGKMCPGSRKEPS